MPEYYHSTCRNCGEDCDGRFCSNSCQEEDAEKKYQKMYENEIEKRLIESDHAHEFANGCSL